MLLSCCGNRKVPQLQLSLLMLVSSNRALLSWIFLVSISDVVRLIRLVTSWLVISHFHNVDDVADNGNAMSSTGSFMWNAFAIKWFCEITRFVILWCYIFSPFLGNSVLDKLACIVPFDSEQTFCENLMVFTEQHNCKHCSDIKMYCCHVAIAIQQIKKLTANRHEK